MGTVTPTAPMLNSSLGYWLIISHCMVHLVAWVKKHSWKCEIILSWFLEKENENRKYELPTNRKEAGQIAGQNNNV